MVYFENDMIHSLKAGDKSAFKELIALYEQRLYVYVFSLTKSNYATEEIIQEVFIKIWTVKETLNPELSFNAYIYKIAKNLTFNHLRKIANQNALKESLWNDIKEAHQRTEDTIIYNEYKDIIDNILNDLPKQKRKIFILSNQEGKTNQEIADELGITPKTVKNHLWKTMQIIRERLRPYLTDSRGCKLNSV